MVQEWLGRGGGGKAGRYCPSLMQGVSHLPSPALAASCVQDLGLQQTFTTWPVSLSASELPCIWVASPTLPTFCKPPFPGPFGASSHTHTWGWERRLPQSEDGPCEARAGRGRAADGRSQCLSCFPLFCKRKCSFDGHLIPEAATCFLSLFTQKIKCGCACAAAIIISLGPRECGWNGRTLGSSKRDNY